MNVRNLIIGFLCVIYNLLFLVVDAQNKKIDSLLAVLKTAKEDTNKVEILNGLAWLITNTGDYPAADSLAHVALQLSNKLNFQKGIAAAWYDIGGNFYYQSNFPKALEAYSKSAEISKEINNKDRLATALNGIGVACEQQGNYPQALDMYSRALDIYKELKSNNGISIAYGNIANVYDEQGKVPQALDNHFKALKISEEIGDKQGVGYECANLGKLYREQHNYTEALEYEFKGLQIVKEIGDKDGMTTIFINLANIYYDQHNYPKALEYSNDALEIAQNIGDKQSIAMELDNLGNIYSDEGDYARALEYDNKGLKIREEIGDKEGIANSTNNIGSTFLKLKKYKDALEYESKSLAVAKEAGALPSVGTAEKSLSEIYEQMGDGMKALENYKAYVTVQDTLFNKENAKKSVQVEMQYEFDKKQAEQKAEQKVKDAKQRIVVWSVVGGLLLVLVFAGFIFRSLRITRKQKQIIEIKNIETEKQKTLIEQQKALVEEKNKDILDSITYAKRLQDAILPPLSVIEKYLPESFVLYKPKDIVAGDFYWLERAGDSILIAAADCTGHRVPGAMVSVVCSNALNRTVKEFKITEPGKILDKVRELVLETFEKSEANVQDGMDISLCCINTKTHEVQWSGAYNSLCYIDGGELKEIAADKQPIGKTDNPKPFATHAGVGKAGTLLYLFTDGYADQFGGPKGKKFKYKQLSDKLLAISGQSMKEQKHILEETLQSWKGSLEQVDDILIIGIRV